MPYLHNVQPRCEWKISIRYSTNRTLYNVDYPIYVEVTIIKDGNLSPPFDGFSTRSLFGAISIACAEILSNKVLSNEELNRDEFNHGKIQLHLENEFIYTLNNIALFEETLEISPATSPHLGYVWRLLSSGHSTKCLDCGNLRANLKDGFGQLLHSFKSINSSASYN